MEICKNNILTVKERYSNNQGIFFVDFTKERRENVRVFRKYQKYRKRIFIGYLALFLSFSYISLFHAIPDSISVERGNTITIGSYLPVTKTVKSEDKAVESFSTNVCGTYQLECRLFGLIPVKDCLLYTSRCV